MDFNNTETRQMLADMAGRFVREQYPIETRHENAASDDGFSRKTWSEMTELGLIGALFKEEAGGFGGEGFDIAVLFEEIGRGLIVEPFLASLLAGTAIINVDPSKTELIEEMVSGTKLVAFAHGEPDSRYDLAHVGATAEKSGDAYVLNGNKSLVFNADAADMLVVSGRTTDGISLFLVDANSDGVHLRSYPTVDGYRAAEIALKDAPATLLGTEGAAMPAIEKACAAATLAVCAEALGAIEVAIDLTLDHLKTRKQFGVPIGKFQALQHRMADMMTEREQIRSAVINAAGHLETDERDWQISAAKNLIGRSGRKIAEEAIQLHGGIGMTWEYAVGHFAKRIVMIDHLFGDEDHHLANIIKLGRAA